MQSCKSCLGLAAKTASSSQKEEEKLVSTPTLLHPQQQKLSQAHSTCLAKRDPVGPTARVLCTCKRLLVDKEATEN